MGFEHTAATLFSAFDLGQAGKIFEEEIFWALNFVTGREIPPGQAPTFSATLRT